MKSTLRYLTLSFGIVYTWFGLLKFFPGLSPAETLAQNTIDVLCFGMIPRNVTIILLAIWEVGVGILFLSNRHILLAVRIAMVHMCCTFLPLFFFQDISFAAPPLVFTLVGQYIVKNVVYLAALGMLYKEYRKEEGAQAANKEVNARTFVPGMDASTAK